jgi:hypothetical protein
MLLGSQEVGCCLKFVMNWKGLGKKWWWRIILLQHLSGLSIKIMNNFNKSFSHLLWSYWTLSPWKYSFPLFIHRSQHLFQFWKYSWNACLGIVRSSASKFSLISSVDSNRHPSSIDFGLVKVVSLVQGLASVEAGGWTSTRVLWENCESEGMNVPEYCNDGATIFSRLPIRPFSPHCACQHFHHLQIIFLVYHMAMR